MNRRILLLAAVPLLLAAVLLLLHGRQAAAVPVGPPVICLDPGHGGDAPGAVNGERMEKDDVLALALRVRTLLEESGEELTVVLTREDDRTLSLEERTELAAAEGASCFVSIHRNSGGGTGIETWTANEPTRGDTALATAIQTRLVEAGTASDRGVRRGTAAGAGGDYFVLSHTADIPSCLVEMGFLDSEGDNADFDAHLEDYAAAIAEGILAACGLR